MKAGKLIEKWLRTMQKALYKAGEKKLGTDEKTFIRIFSERSGAHLAAVDAAYHCMYGNFLKKAVKNETSGHFHHAPLTILQCSQNPAKYFVKVLHKAMKGLGTNDTALIRVIVTRTEIDMQYIKAESLKKDKKTLNDAVHSETSGHYSTFLLALLGPTISRKITSVGTNYTRWDNATQPMDMIGVWHTTKDEINATLCTLYVRLSNFE